MRRPELLFPSLLAFLSLSGCADKDHLADRLTGIVLKHHLVLGSIHLQKQVIHDFYMEQPLLITLTGDYHDLGGFVSDLAQLPRPVTLYSFSIAPKQTGSGDNELLMTLYVSSYHHRDEYKDAST